MNTRWEQVQGIQINYFRRKLSSGEGLVFSRGERWFGQFISESTTLTFNHGGRFFCTAEEAMHAVEKYAETH